MKQSEENRLGEKPKGTITVTTKVPKVALFTLKEDSNPNYEKLLQRIHNRECESIASSGSWHEGEYRVQVHYYEVTIEEKPREDTDTETPVGKEDKSEEKSKEKTEEDVEIRDNTIVFDDSIEVATTEKDKVEKKKAEKKNKSSKKSSTKSSLVKLFIQYGLSETSVMLTTALAVLFVTNISIAASTSAKVLSGEVG